ncbi:F-box/kelch-repeat protein At3g06240-like [Quercus robur]|uniref:F-box/kelch-repeat protein At3g06240-like n=1 Tax=Quercus robur TaxID=38942 RepID=UPI0021613028|nr:F-box/kelch-repeat protein At3g06240-like [Quercus robur]
MSELRGQPPILRRRKNHVPDDIVLNNILTRVPVKSLMRFRIYETGIPSDFGLVKIVGSCNGLLCLTGFNPSNDKYSCPHPSIDIYLWNPSIRKFKKLPDTCLGQLRCVKLRFDYHSENNDYKVVRISLSPLSGHEIEVYTLSSDSWRRYEILLPTNVVILDISFYYPLVSGALHWMAYINGENRRTETIMAFDVNSEKFRKLELPDNSMISNDRCLALFKGKLAYIECGRIQPCGFQYSIWVMRQYGVVETWHKIFVVPFLQVTSCIAFTEYGSLLVWCIDHQVKNKEFKFLLIDTENLHEKELDIQFPSIVTNFMDSLVLLDGANVVSY